MSDWFFMLGQPITSLECDRANEYLWGLGFGKAFPVEGVSDWAFAMQVLTHSEWERDLWEAEQQEMHRLRAIAKEVCGEARVRESLSAAVTASESAHGCAAISAARLGCADAGLIRAAAGAASEAAYLARLAELANEPDHEAFSAKQALFAAGHWPLGATSGRYYIF